MARFFFWYWATDVTLTANRVVKRKDGWYVLSQLGKSLGGPYRTQVAAERRLKQVEMFKHMKTNTFQRLTINLKPNIRHDTMEGRKYLVAPMVMLTEGVHAGSNGPLYYPPDELGKTPVIWNHKPIVVYHPQKDGNPTTACDPVVLTNRKVGVIMNSAFDGSRLTAEAWMEEERLKAVDDRVLTALEAGQMVEISTGLFTDNERVEKAEWNGEEYESVAHNLRPDHLAILPDQKGACSIEDGAGLLRNQAGEIELTPAETTLLAEFRTVQNEKSHDDRRRELSKLIRPANSGGGEKEPAEEWAYVLDVYDSLVVFEKNGKIYAQDYEVDAKDNAKLKGTPTQVQRVTQYQTMDGKPITNAPLSSGGRKRLKRSDFAIPEKRKYPIHDAAHARNALARVAQFGTNEEKRRVRAAVKRRYPGIKVTQNLKGNAMEKAEMILALVESDATTWGEEDKQVLEGFEDDVLEKMLPVANTEEEETETKPQPKVDPDPKPTENKDDTPADETHEVTVDEYVANAPPEIRDMLTDMRQTHQAAKDKLVATITANERCKFTAEQLAEKPMGELRALAELAAPQTPQKGQQPTGNYAGQGEPASGGPKIEPLEIPTLKFGT